MIKVNILQSAAILLTVLTSVGAVSEMAGESFKQGVAGGSPDEALKHCMRILTGANPDAVLENCTKVIIARSDDAYAYLYRGLAKQQKGYLNGAMEDFTKAIEIAPAYDTPYYWRSKLKEAQGDAEGAKQDIEKFIQVQKTSDYTLERLNKVIDADPENADLYLKRAEYKRYNYRKHDYEGAVKDYDRYIALAGKPKSDLIYSYRGHSKEMTGDVEGAMADYELMIKEFPDSTLGYECRARLKKSLGNHEGVQADRREIKRIQGERYANKAELFSRKLENRKRTSKNTTEIIGILTQRAYAYMKLENYADAIKDLDKIIEIDPKAIFAYSLRAKAKKKTGDLEGYRKDIEEVKAVKQP